MSEKARERRFNLKLTELLSEVENHKHQGILTLIAKGFTHAETAETMGLSESYVGKVWRSKRYAHIRRKMPGLRAELLPHSDEDFKNSARRWRNENAISILDRVKETGEPRDLIQALRVVGKWTKLEEQTLEVRGTVDHRHVLQSPEMRQIRQMLDSGRAVIVGDAPPAFELPEPDEIEAEVVEEVSRAAD